MFTDILWADGQYNPGGITTTLYYAPAADIDTLPNPSGNPATMADAVTISSDIVFKQGKNWHKIYCTLETGEVKSSQVGEKDGKSWENSLEGFFPGTKAEMLGFAELAANSNFVFLVKERTGQFRVMGSVDLPAWIESNEVTSGKAIADRKGMTFTVKSVGKIAPIYTGAVQLP